eukprot:10271704-Alexandrium_andersonii.AAC.1
MSAAIVASVAIALRRSSADSGDLPPMGISSKPMLLWECAPSAVLASAPRARKASQRRKKQRRDRVGAASPRTACHVGRWAPRSPWDLPAQGQSPR